MTNSTKSPRALFTLSLLLATGVILLLTGSAAAASPIAKDGRMHACYKVKGKGKGTLRLVGSGKARCPRKWRKIAWQATPVPGPRGERGAPGPAGSSSSIEGLKTEVSVLRTQVETLESLLKGVTNQDLLRAVGLAPVVESLCSQAGILTGRVNLLEGALGGLSLNGVLTTLGGLLNLPVLPGALPVFSCEVS
ncbi:MAG TPA: hypothetical protein VD741_08385 [Solirubrobacterales bacterium]|nr:hypothetical protein [Solirubrobacterales bacterium]